MIRSWKGYRFVSEMSLSRDVLITLIRSEHGYRYVIKMSLLSTLSFKKVKLTLMSMSMFLTWSRMPWKYQESCILTQCSAKIVIRYILHQGMYHTSTLREGWSQRPLRNRVIISDKKWKKREKVKKSEKSERKVRKKCSAVSPLLCSIPITQVRFSMSNYILHPGNASISIIYQQGGIFYCCNCRNDLLLTCYD